MIQEMDPLQGGLMFNIQTSPISMLVQPTNSSTQTIATRKSESPTRSSNPDSDGAKLDSMRRANSESLANGPQKPLSIILARQATAQDTLQSVPSMNGSSNDSEPSADSLQMSAGSILSFSTVNGDPSTEYTNPPQVGHVPLSSSNDLRTSTSAQGGVREEPSSASYS
jgi:hypothetical protein